MRRWRSGVAALSLSLSGCAVSDVILTGTPRPPLEPSRVQVYLAPPTASYVEIGRVRASSRHSWAFGSAAQIDKVIERLKREAARVGANGILLHGVGRGAAGSVGATVSTDSGRSPYVDALGGSLVFHPEYGDGVAIYVAEH